MSTGEDCAVWSVAVLIVLAMLFIGPAIELWLWGLVMIPVFGAPALTYWQMFALNWLCGLLFRRGGSGFNFNTKK